MATRWKRRFSRFSAATESAKAGQCGIERRNSSASALDSGRPSTSAISWYIGAIMEGKGRRGVWWCWRSSATA